MALRRAVQGTTKLFCRPAPTQLGARWFSGGAQEAPAPLGPIEFDEGDGAVWAQIVQSLEEQAPIIQENDRASYQAALNMAKSQAEKLKDVVYPDMSRDAAGARDEIASVLDNVGDKQGVELAYRVIGGVDTKEEYYGSCAIYGPFGTDDKPVMVPSDARYRYVGCVGGYHGEEEHALVWFLLRQGPKHRCPMCGQIWQLVTSDTSHPDHPLHDPSLPYEKTIAKKGYCFGFGNFDGPMGNLGDKMKMDPNAAYYGMEEHHDHHH